MLANYNAIMEYLFSKLPMFTRIGSSAIKKDLTNIKKLCDALGNPHLQFKSIHIAGTNGKGSVSNLLASILFENGYKTGLHTSPHLIDYKERFRINNYLIPEKKIVDFVIENQKIIEEIKPSFFELSVALAFKWFADEKVDIAIIETGLGGRLDSTNIITPVLSVITHISIDHKDMLGETLELIATEKAGIIKKGVPVVIGNGNNKVIEVFENKALLENSKLYKVEDYLRTENYSTDLIFGNYTFKDIKENNIVELQSELIGEYQIDNIATALLSTKIIEENFPTQEENTFRGIKNVKTNMKFRGRWDVLKHSPIVIVDGAHNEDALQKLFDTIRKIKFDNLIVIIGFMKDKDVDKITSILPKKALYICTTAEQPRSSTPEEVAEILNKQNLQTTIKFNCLEAYEYAMNIAEKNDLVLVSGSLFIVGKLYEYLEKN